MIGWPLPPDQADAAESEGAPGRGVPREVLRQVRLIELRTRGLVDNVFGGEYQSVFRGQGIEFAEVREYQPGDDVRTIDWNVTARMGEPFVKQYVEERELTLMLVVDLSGSEQFGTRARFKAELAAEIGAVIALSAATNNDRTGLLIFTDRVEHSVPPKKGRRHALRLIRDVLAFRPEGRGTDLAGALDFAGRVLPHRAIVFVLSDFQLAAEDDQLFDRTLRVVSRRHDVVAVKIADPRELELPDAGLLRLRDPETGEIRVVDTGSREVRQRFRAASLAREAAMRRRFRRLGVDEIEVATDQPYAPPLLAFFERRARAARR
ncbi:MAG TPA: DUF58 domain-containing protein [Longimicrobiales bacterium]|nr:DUF58 domain-containing protein [Longimicrobiales bacterium]